MLLWYATILCIVLGILHVRNRHRYRCADDIGQGDDDALETRSNNVVENCLFSSAIFEFLKVIFVKKSHFIFTYKCILLNFVKFNLIKFDYNTVGLYY